MEIKLLLEAIYCRYGYDFRNYTLNFLRRRILKRLDMEKTRSISALQEKVLHDHKFVEKIITDFAINYTEMFRNPFFFQALRTKVFPVLQKLPFIRIWHAGCSTGEEIYSMAILLYEAGLYDRSVIYATDIDENALMKAQKGVVPLEKMQLFTKNYQKSGGERAFSEYYTVENRGVKINSNLLKNIVFSQHNLVSDESFNEFHLIICRNVMIYFNAQLQNRVHRLFYESLGDLGFLGLGERETISFTSFADYYKEIDSKEKVYLKIK